MAPIMTFDCDEAEAEAIATAIELLMASDKWAALPLAQRACVRTIAQELRRGIEQHRALWPGQIAYNLPN